MAPRILLQYPYTDCGITGGYRFTVQEGKRPCLGFHLSKMRETLRCPSRQARQNRLREITHNKDDQSSERVDHNWATQYRSARTNLSFVTCSSEGDAIKRLVSGLLGYLVFRTMKTLLSEDQNPPCLLTISLTTLKSCVAR